MDSIDYWAGQVRQLEHEIVDARRRALESPPCASFFVFFKTQKDAAIAAQTNIHPEDGRSFRVVEAPGPEEVTHRCRPLARGNVCIAIEKPNRWSLLLSVSISNYMATTAPAMTLSLGGIRRGPVRLTVSVEGLRQ